MSECMAIVNTEIVNEGEKPIAIRIAENEGLKILELNVLFYF